MVTVTKHFSFEACHHLPHYVGPCHNIHGHSYKLDVTVGGSIIKDSNSPKQGMIIDFKDLKKLVNEKVIQRYDHSDLNDYFPNPTAEIMVKSIATEIISGLPKGVYLVCVKLWETEDSYAEWSVYDEIMIDRNPLLQPGLMSAT